jgi:hypothetical protein
MCEKCRELDSKITHYLLFTGPQFDGLTRDRITALISDLQRIRDALHHEHQMGGMKS